MRSCSPLQLLPPLTPHPPPFFSSSFKEVFHPFIRNLINVRHPSHFSTHTHKHTHTQHRPTHTHMHKGKHPHTHTLTNTQTFANRSGPWSKSQAVVRLHHFQLNDVH